MAPRVEITVAWSVVVIEPEKVLALSVPPLPEKVLPELAPRLSLSVRVALATVRVPGV